MRFRLRVRTLMLVVLAVGLVAGLVVQIVRTRRTPYVPHGGGGGGNIRGTRDGGVEIELSHGFFGADETANPIRWEVSVTPVDPAVLDPSAPGSPLRVGPPGLDPSALGPPVFEADYGTPSAPAAGEFADEIAERFSLPPTCKVFRGDLRKSLPLKLAPGSYFVHVYSRDGLKVRNKAGKIVDRARVGGGWRSSRVEIPERGGGQRP